EYDWEKMLTAPVESGTQVGEIRYMVDGTVYKSERIITVDSVPEINFEWCLRQVLERFLPCCN
ncbi:MAG: D-alanyl-D-alanine carboxypeptidase, partial [Acetatifactor sp.]|nr:D-alanyl-D-alanine carboxypeptidase [Acetatifactor sp.]